MSRPSPRCSRCFIAICAALSIVCSYAVGQASGEATLSAQETSGKEIYRKGHAGPNGEIKAFLPNSDSALSGKNFACSNCHGATGAGTSEGGLKPPPLDWETLSAGHTSALSGRTREPYNESTLIRAITNGIDASGAPLHRSMPRYQLTEAQASSLIAYLKVLSKPKDHDPGISESKITVGAALPLSGPLASVGADIRAVLLAYFKQVNDAGGIYGRSVELAVEDSRVDASGTLAATRRLIEVHKVFALVAGFEPAASDALLMGSEVPLIGPATLSPHVTIPPNRFVFYLLPTFSDQARCLADYVNAEASRQQGSVDAGQVNSPRTAHPRLAVIHSKGDFNEDATAGLIAQARLHSLKVIGDLGYESGQFSVDDADAMLVRTKPEYVFFFGDQKDIKSLASKIAREKHNVQIATSMAMLGRDAFDLPKAVARTLLLAYPGALPGRDDFSELIALMKKSDDVLRSPAFQALAYAGAKLFVEAAKRSGRQISRAGLIGSLEQLRDFATGVMPPLTFGPSRRVGARGCYVVRADADDMRYVALTDWRAVQEAP